MPKTGPFSVVRLRHYWYVACRSRELDRRPLARTILDRPLVLFRDDAGTPHALLDRCPHRNVPLSQGQVLPTGVLQCGYHGWQFNGEGACTAVPGLRPGRALPRQRVATYAVTERDGFVWVYGTAGTEPEKEPFSLAGHRQPGYTTVRRTVSVEGTLQQTAENALDVPHTAYLHRGLFRGGKENLITAIVRSWPDRVEAEYQGEPLPPGIVARILSPRGGIVEHWDRFFLPSVAQVEYRLGPENHFLVTSLMTPVNDGFTHLYAVVSYRLRFPGWIVRPFLEPLARRIFRQDAEILKAQTECVRRFGREKFVSTEIDLVGPSIWRLLKRAQGGDPEPADEPTERRVEFFA